MPDPSALSHSIVRDAKAFDALEPEWSDLFRRAAVRTSFLRYSWLQLCWARQRDIPDTRLFTVVVRESERPVLIAPFVLRPSRILFHRLAFLDSLTPQYNDVLVEDSVHAPRYVDYLWTTLRSMRRIRRFVSLWVRADSLLVPHLAAARQTSKASHKAAFVDLAKFGDWDVYLHALSQRLRQDHGRQVRNLERLGAVELRLANATTCRADMAWLFSQKRQWLDLKNKTARWLAAPGTEELFTAAALEGMGSGRTWLMTISVGGTTIAADLGFREDSTLYVSKLAYDPAWHTHSPARTLLLLTIKRAFQEGLQKCDLMIGGGPWKDRIATGAIQTFNHRIRLHFP